MTCAIELRCHTRYMAYGPIAFGVRMEADAATHQAVNGLLDRALEVVLVRRDAPGVRFLTKTDPGGLFLPDPVAPPPLPGMSATARVIEEREFDLLDHGRRHDGAATYFAFACFADAISDARAIEVVHGRTQLPPGDAPPLAPLAPSHAQALIALLPHRPGLVARLVARDGLRLEGSVTCAPPANRFGLPPPRTGFVTVVAIHRGPRGGVSARSFQLASPFHDGWATDAFSLPIAELFPELTAPAQLLVFSGDLAPARLDLPA